MEPEHTTVRLEPIPATFLLHVKFFTYVSGSAYNRAKMIRASRNEHLWLTVPNGVLGQTIYDHVRQFLVGKKIISADHEHLDCRWKNGDLRLDRQDEIRTDGRYVQCIFADVEQHVRHRLTGHTLEVTIHQGELSAE